MFLFPSFVDFMNNLNKIKWVRHVHVFKSSKPPVALISDLAIVHDELPFKMFSDNIVDLWVIVKPHKWKSDFHVVCLYTCEQSFFWGFWGHFLNLKFENF
jgi:hypothetical protein